MTATYPSISPGSAVPPGRIPTKVSELPQAEQVTGSEILMLLQNGVLKQSPLSSVLPLAGEGGGGGGTSDHGALTGLLDDDHPQYFNQTRGDARYELLGTWSSGLASHEVAADPHPQYLTVTEGNIAYAPIANPNLTGTPLAPTAVNGTNTTQIATTAFVQSQIGLLLGAAPGLLDTFDEIANSLGDDPNFATTMTTALSGKLAASAVSGFALTLLDDADAVAMRVTLGLGTAATAASSSFATAAHSHADATTSVSGFMSGTDKTKLNGIAAGATVNSSDATLLARANHTGTQVASTISDFAEAVDDRVATLLEAGANITITYNDALGTITIDSTGGGGGGGVINSWGRTLATPLILP